MTNSPHDATTVTQWLDIQRERFYAELENHLDIEAGLEEVLLAEHHDELVDIIQKNLDVEGGLAAILPAPTITVPQEQSFLVGSLEWATESLARMPLQQRLMLRAHYASRLGFAAREVGTLETGAITAERFDEMARQINEILAPKIYMLRGLGYPESRLLDLRNSLVHGSGTTFAELREVAELLVQQSQIPEIRSASETFLLAAGHEAFLPNEAIGGGAFAASVTDLFSSMAEMQVKHVAETMNAEEWRSAVAEYVGAMLASVQERIKPLSPNMPDRDGAVEQIRELVSHLAFLEQMLNDFVGADLRHAELTGVSLDGLRWSDQTTRWPDSWRERIEQDSVHIYDDVYEVHYGTHIRERNTLV